MPKLGRYAPILDTVFFLYPLVKMHKLVLDRVVRDF